MKNYPTLIRHEFFKLRKTLAFRSAWILPLLINLLIVVIFIAKAEELLKNPIPNMWFRYLNFVMGIMGSLILPMYVVFLTFSVNDIEHKADTWKNLLSYPIEKRQVFLGKWFSSVLIFALFMLSFYVFTYLGGHLLGRINPEFGFQHHEMGVLMLQIFTKMFLASIALICIQFFFSMLWSDFMKSMGIGLVLTIASMIIMQWEYVYISPYAQPMYSINTLFEAKSMSVNFNSIEIWIGLGTSFVFLTLAYQLMKKRSIR